MLHFVMHFKNSGKLKVLKTLCNYFLQLIDTIVSDLWNQFRKYYNNLHLWKDDSYLTDLNWQKVSSSYTLAH